MRDRLNVSAVCRSALEARVNHFERLTRALVEEDAMERLVARLKVEKQESSGWSYDRGQEGGQSWAIHAAPYDALVEWSQVDPYFLGYADGIPFPHKDEEAAEILRDAREAARYEGRVLDDDAYAQGFLDAVRTVWHEVADRL